MNISVIIVCLLRKPTELPRMLRTVGLFVSMMTPFDLNTAYVFLSYHAFTNTEKDTASSKS